MKLLVTRPTDDPLFSGLDRRSLVYVPFTRSERDPAAAHRCRAKAEAPDVLLFTSANAARAVGAEHGLRPARVAAVGPATAKAATEIGLKPDDLDAGTGEALVKALGNLRGKTVLWPRGREAHPATGEALRRAGANLVEVIVYAHQQVTDLAGRLVPLLPFDAAIMLSPRSVQQLVEALGGRAPSVITIGPTTTQAAHDAEVRVLAQAGRPDAASLAAAVRHVIR